MRSRDDNQAHITGSVLEWARLRSGMTRTALGEKVRASGNQIADWESGTSSPPFDTAQTLAKVLRIPFGFLFLPKPPQGELPLPDFRTLDPRYKPTPDFLELLNDVLVKQDWFRDYLTDQGEPSLKFVGSFTIDNKVSEVAASIRTRLAGCGKTREFLGG